jgi:isochorismate pyruvate lyase
MNNALISSLEEVRSNIDRIDRQIIALLAERQFYVKQAARFKKSVIEVEAPARVEAVIAKVKIQAEEHGLNAEMVENVYRTLIDGFIKEERKEFK